jgi:hypothetical protein
MAFRPGGAVSARCCARVVSATFDWLVTADPHLDRIDSLGEIYTIPTRAVRAALRRDSQYRGAHRWQCTAQRGLDEAIALARLTQAELEVLHIVDAYPLLPDMACLRMCLLCVMRMASLC